MNKPAEEMTRTELRDYIVEDLIHALGTFTVDEMIEDRKNLGLSQGAIARLIGVSAATVRRFERQKQITDRRMECAYLAALHMFDDYVYGED